MQLELFEEIEHNFQEFNNKHRITNYVDTFNTIQSSDKFTVLSLFSGCGGLDLGFRGEFEFLAKISKKQF